MKFKFNCYSYKIDSLTPKFNLETEESNSYITFSDGSKIYYELTEEKNYTEIVVPTKRHNRSKYKQAVKAQLLYFPNVKFTITYEGGSQQEEKFQANILYNSERLIVSDNTQFSKPHIVIVKGEKDDTATGVCYGFIDFQEMEMQQLYGNVGVKCPIRSVIRDEITGEEEVLQEGVEVTPSRESVVWSEHTRNFLIKRFNEAVDEATEMIQSELKTNDFLEWLGKCSKVKSKVNGGDNKALYQLSKVINVDDISPSYQDTGIKLTHPETFFRGLRVRRCYSSYDSSKKRNVIVRENLRSWGDFNNDRVFFKTVATSTKTDQYLYEKGGVFITIEIMDEEQLTKEYLIGDQKDRISEQYLKTCIVLRDKIIDLMKLSSKINDYDTIVVPEDFSKKVEEAEEKDKELEMSKADKRKMLGAVAIHNMVPNTSYYNNSTQRPFTFSQKDEFITDLQEFEGDIIYGFLDDTDHLMLLGQVLDVQASGPNFNNNIYGSWNNPKFNNKNIRIMRISKQTEKYLKNNEQFRHVSDFFQKVEDIDGQ